MEGVSSGRVSAITRRIWGRSERPLDQPADRLRGVAPALVFAHDAVTDLHGAVLRRRPLVPRAADQGAPTGVARQEDEVHPPAMLIGSAGQPVAGELQRRGVEELGRPGRRDASAQTGRERRRALQRGGEQIFGRGQQLQALGADHDRANGNRSFVT